MPREVFKAAAKIHEVFNFTIFEAHFLPYYLKKLKHAHR